MTSILYNKKPLVLNPELASVIGLNESIIVQQMHYWMEKNKEANRNFHDGRFWTFNAYKEWKEQFSFWSERTIRRIIKDLEKRNIIFATDKYNKKAYDQTKWYSINFEELEKLEAERAHGQVDQAEVDNLDRGGGQVDQGGWSECPGGVDKLTKPIPEITPEISSEISTENKNINRIKKNAQIEASQSPKKYGIKKPIKTFLEKNPWFNAFGSDKEKQHRIAEKIQFAFIKTEIDYTDPNFQQAAIEGLRKFAVDIEKGNKEIIDDYYGALYSYVENALEAQRTKEELLSNPAVEAVEENENGDVFIYYTAEAITKRRKYFEEQEAEEKKRAIADKLAAYEAKPTPPPPPRETYGTVNNLWT